LVYNKAGIPPQVSIVNASAGSGKTYALARQYIDLLLNPRDPQDFPLREILAITFTNKATLQMKERILEFLKKIALGKFLDEYKKDRKTAITLMDTIIRNYHFFQVQTIDSFIKSILSGCTFKMDFSSSFRIKEDYSEDLAYSLDKLIDKTGQDKKILNLFVRFLKQYLYVENRVSWFVKKDILSLMDTMFSLNNIYGDRFKKSEVKDTSLIIKKKDVLKSMKKLKDTAPEGTNQRFFKSLASFLDKNRDGFDIDNIPASLANPEFPLNKGYLLPKETEKLWRTIRRDLKEVCEVESLSLLNPYIDIFDMVVDEFRNLAIRDDILFLEELNRHARALFDSSSITIGELYYRIATRLKHYLIDEFQDTSRLQWKNLVMMVEEALSTGGSLFCVSDRKQAIYRFRGGDVSLLDYVEDRFKKFNVEQKTRNKNFRSQKELVLFNNEVFSEKNIKDFLLAKERLHQRSIVFTSGEMEEIVKNFKDSEQTYKKENIYGYVKIECVEAQDKEAREELIKGKVLTRIEELSKRFPYEDIAVLTRDNDEVELVTGWLLEKGIPVESGKTLNIKRHPYIKEIISFMKFLNSPIDNLSFSSFILGDIFTQATGLSNDQMRDFIFEIRGKKGGSYFYKEFEERYQDVWNNFIDMFFKNVGFVPLYEFTVNILSRFNVIEKFPEYQGFFMRFLELVKEQEEVNASLPLFLDFFDKAEGNELYVDIVDSKYVKVLTIHKSKGLEFPVVIIPFLEMDIRVGMGKNSRRSFTVYSKDKGLEMRRLKRRYGNFSEPLDALYREEYKKAFIDELNNVYVAFTRAKNELYIFIPERSAGKNLVRLLVPMQNGEAEFGKPEATVPSARWDANKVKIPPSRYKDWIPLLLDEFIDVSKIKQRQRLLKGEVFHYILSYIGNLSDSNINVLVNDAIEAASLKFPFVNMKEFESVIKKVLKDKKLRRFFFVEDGVVYQEKEVVNHFGDTYRIDRLIVRKDVIEIIDYKSSRDDMESFYKQIHKYITAVKDLYPGKDVKGYLIFLDNFSVEQI